jgi:hypothetical protein
MTQEDFDDSEKIELQDEELDSIAEYKFSSSTSPLPCTYINDQFGSKWIVPKFQRDRNTWTEDRQSPTRKFTNPASLFICL